MKRLFYLVIILFTHFESTAQWQKIGSPSGGAALCVIRNATHVVAGCNDGIYYSTDDANTWTRSQVPQVTMGRLLFLGNKLIAASDCGLYQSYDNGETFTLLHPGWSCCRVNFLKQIDTLLWCGVDNFGVFYSADSGSTWTPSNTNITHTLRPFDLVKHGSELFLGIDTTVYRSSNNGASWNVSGTGLAHLRIRALISYSNLLFAGTEGWGVYKSADSGLTWNQLQFGQSIYVNSMIQSDSIIYATSIHNGIYISSDSGQTWTSRHDSLGVYYVISLFKYNNTLYAATNGAGINTSTDNGIHWTKKSNGIESTGGTFAVSGNSIFLATEGDGIHKSNDGGFTWSPVFEQSGQGNCESMILIDSTIIAGGWGFGMVRSSDLGTSWTQINNGIAGPTGIQLNGFFWDSIYVWANCGYKTYKTSDLGNTWIQSDSGMTNRNIFSMAKLGDTLFAGVFYGDVYRSFNNGDFWQHDTNNINNDAVFSFEIFGNKIIALALNGTWESWDRGDTWTHISNFGGATCTVRNGNDLYVGTDLLGVNVSYDEGMHWMPINSGLPNNCIISDLIIQNGYLIISTREQGVWRLNLSTIEVGEINKNALTVYPNPVTDKVNISWGERKSKVIVEILDLCGRIVSKSTVYNSMDAMIDLKLSNGVYIISVSGENFRMNRKVVVK